MAVLSRIPENKNTTAPRQFMGFASDDVTRVALQRAADNQGWVGATVAAGGVAEAVQALTNTSTPSLLVVDVSNSEDPLGDIEGLADVCDPGTRLIALGAVNDVALYRALIDMGVDDYLLKPVSAKVIDAAFQKAEETATQSAQEPHHGDEDAGDKGGRVVAVVGARGGVGATSVALNTAWTLAHDHGKRVALVDLDLYFGSVALALDLESGRGFREALENPERIDALFIERAMVRAADNLFVLAAEEPLETAFDFDPEALNSLIDILRADFDFVVLDLPRFAARTQIPVLGDGSVLCVVSDPTLASMRDSLRLVRLSNDIGVSLDIDVILNGTGASKVGELAATDFERDKSITIAATIPYDAKAMGQAAGEGSALADVAKGSPALGAIKSYVTTLVSDGADASGRSFWRRLMKGGA